MRTLALAALTALYAAGMLCRAPDDVALKLFGFDLGSAPVGIIALLSFCGLTFFAAAGVLLPQMYLRRMTRSLRIWGREFPVNETTAPIIARGVSVTCLGLILGIAAIFVPSPTIHLCWIEFSGGIILAVAASFGSSLWAFRRLKNFR